MKNSNIRNVKMEGVVPDVDFRGNEETHRNRKTRYDPFWRKMYLDHEKLSFGFQHQPVDEFLMLTLPPDVRFSPEIVHLRFYVLEGE